MRSEIEAIANLRRVSVDTGLTRGRVEIRAYLDDPDAALRASGLDAIPDLRVEAGAAGDGDDYLACLRAAIFALRHPRCFDARVLRQVYDGTATPVSTEMLAELVACPRCLDTVNRMTRLPVLADRHPRDAHDDGPDDGRERRIGPRRTAPRHDQEQRMCRLAAEQTARVIRAHRPRALRVLVNGFQIGSHDLTAEVTRATHALAGPEPPRVVEVYSEQRVCLATLQVETVPDAAVSQETTIALDEGRRLELSVVFDAQWPTLHLVFVQPLDASETEEWIEDAVPVRERSAGMEIFAAAVERERAGSSALSRLWMRPFVLASRRLRLAASWPLRPAFVGLAVLMLVAAMIGPGRAWAAVVDAGRTIAKWVSDVVLDVPAPASRSDRRSGGDAAHRDDVALRAATAMAAAAPAPATASARSLRGLTESALLGLEVDVLERLDRAGALYGEDITLTRPRSGYLRLEGMVDHSERRRALVDALGALASIPQFEVRLRTIPDTAPAPAAEANTRTATRVFEVERDQSPVSSVLADALMKQGVAAGPPLDDMARALSVRVVNASHDALRHTWAFKRLARHVEGNRLRTTDPEAHRRWRELLGDHVTAFTRHSAQIQAELTAIGLLPNVDQEFVIPQLDAELDAEQFVKLAEQQDRSVRALFSSAPAAGVEVDARQTLRDLAVQLRWSAIAGQRLLDR